jgi:hypothetical protein
MHANACIKSIAITDQKNENNHIGFALPNLRNYNAVYINRKAFAHHDNIAHVAFCLSPPGNTIKIANHSATILYLLRRIHQRPLIRFFKVFVLTIHFCSSPCPPFPASPLPRFPASLLPRFPASRLPAPMHFPN